MKLRDQFRQWAKENTGWGKVFNDPTAEDSYFYFLIWQGGYYKGRKDAETEMMYGQLRNSEMFAIGDDELKEPLGDTILCKVCGERHAIQYGDEVLKDGTRRPSKLLAFYKCGDEAYLAGINGKAI